MKGYRKIYFYYCWGKYVANKLAVVHHSSSECSLQGLHINTLVLNCHCFYSNNLHGQESHRLKMCVIIDIHVAFSKLVKFRKLNRSFQSNQNQRVKKMCSDLLYSHRLAHIEFPFPLKRVQVPELSRVRGGADGIAP